MNRDILPNTPTKLADKLYRLRLKRRKRKNQIEKMGQVTRRNLTRVDREVILRKTGRRCHICGGKIRRKWQADHVLACSVGGHHAVENYLPAHKVCNHYRWDYSADEFQYILKIGVWTRTQIERRSKVGLVVASGFLAHERAREARRKSDKIQKPA
jgi:hypothetical protein